MTDSTPRIVIAGGGGFIGRALAQRLHKDGYDVAVLSRSPDRVDTPARAVKWDGQTLGDWANEIDGAAAVINLAGKNVNCRYTKKNLREIDESRVHAVTVMSEAINRAATKPGVLIQASTTAIYGHRFDQWVDETALPGFHQPLSSEAVGTAVQWEHAFHAHPTPGVRRVLLRISFALGPGGGALTTLETLTRRYLGGAAGNGRQYISWIHIDDLCELVAQAIDDDAMAGLYNVATPHPVTNAAFMRELRRVLGRPWAPPTPAPLVHLGCFFMRTEPVLALTGRRVRPRRLIERGFAFRYPELSEALEAVYQPGAVSTQSMGTRRTPRGR